MSSEQFYVIDADEDGDVSIRRYESKESLLAYLEDNYCDDGDWALPHAIKPDRNGVYRLDCQCGLLIIRGDVVQIKPKELIASIDVE